MSVRWSAHVDAYSGDPNFFMLGRGVGGAMVRGVRGAGCLEKGLGLRRLGVLSKNYE